MAGTTTTTADDLVQAAIAEARLVIDQRARLKNFVLRRSLEHVPGKTVDFPLWANVTAAALTEGTDLTTNTALSTTKASITAAEVGVMTTVSDLAETATEQQVGVDAGKILGNAIARKINQDLFAQFDSFTTEVGTTDTDITPDLVRSALSRLVQSNAPGPYTLAVTPHVYDDLLAAWDQTGTAVYRFSQTLTEDAQRKGIIDELYGVNIVIVSDLADGTDAGERDAADIVCGMFSAEALGYVEKWPVRIERQRDASLRGYELVATACYGTGIIHDAWGVGLLADNKD